MIFVLILDLPLQDRTHLTVISSYQKDIMTILPSYYNTFVDVMEFHEVALEVITSLATVQFYFDIVSNVFYRQSCLSNTTQMTTSKY